jgi:hypothetical protein
MTAAGTLYLDIARCEGYVDFIVAAVGVEELNPWQHVRLLQ